MSSFLNFFRKITGNCSDPTTPSPPPERTTQNSSNNDQKAPNSDSSIDWPSAMTFYDGFDDDPFINIVKDIKPDPFLQPYSYPLIPIPFIPPKKVENDSIIIFIKLIATKHTFKYNTKSTTIQQIKHDICTISPNFHIEDQLLVFAGQRLDDDTKTIHDYQITPYSTLHVVLQLHKRPPQPLIENIPPVLLFDQCIDIIQNLPLIIIGFIECNFIKTLFITLYIIYYIYLGQLRTYTSIYPQLFWSFIMAMINIQFISLFHRTNEQLYTIRDRHGDNHNIYQISFQTINIRKPMNEIMQYNNNPNNNNIDQLTLLSSLDQNEQPTDFIFAPTIPHPTMNKTPSLAILLQDQLTEDEDVIQFFYSIPNEKIASVYAKRSDTIYILKCRIFLQYKHFIDIKHVQIRYKTKLLKRDYVTIEQYNIPNRAAFFVINTSPPPPKLTTTTTTTNNNNNNQQRPTQRIVYEFFSSWWGDNNTTGPITL